MGAQIKQSSNVQIMTSKAGSSNSVQSNGGNDTYKKQLEQLMGFISKAHDEAHDNASLQEEVADHTLSNKQMEQLEGAISKTLHVAFANGTLQESLGSGSVPFTGGTGLLMAIICEALRDAQANDLKRQLMQAQTEQQFDAILQKVLPQVAQAIVNQGNATADGLIAQGISSAVSAGVQGTMALGSAGVGIYQSRQIAPEEEQLTTLKAQREDLDDPNKAGDVILGQKGMQEDESLLNEEQGQEMQEMNPNKLGKVKLEPEELQEAKAKKDREIKEKEDKIRDYQRNIDHLFQVNNTVSSITSAATQAAGSVQKADKDVQAAYYSAEAENTKQLGQTDSTAANSFKDSARSASQDAIATAKTLADIAQSQVQMRG